MSIKSFARIGKDGPILAYHYISDRSVLSNLLSIGVK